GQVRPGECVQPRVPHSTSGAGGELSRRVFTGKREGQSRWAAFFMSSLKIRPFGTVFFRHSLDVLGWHMAYSVLCDCIAWSKRMRQDLSPELIQLRLDNLRSRVRGRVILPGDSDYDEARRAWNLTVEQRPEVIVVAENTTDIVEAVRYARMAGLGIAVMA